MLIKVISVKTVLVTVIFKEKIVFGAAACRSAHISLSEYPSKEPPGNLAVTEHIVKKINSNSGM